MTKIRANRKDNLRDGYFAGTISLDQYVNQIINGKDGDRKRRNIEKKYDKLTQRRELQRS